MRSLLCAAAAAALRPRVAVRRGSVPSLVPRARNDASSCAGAPSIAARAEAARRRRCSALRRGPRRRCCSRYCREALLLSRCATTAPCRHARLCAAGPFHRYCFALRPRATAAPCRRLHTRSQLRTAAPLAPPLLCAAGLARPQLRALL